MTVNLGGNMLSNTQIGTINASAATMVQADIQGGIYQPIDASLTMPASEPFVDAGALTEIRMSASSVYGNVDIGGAVAAQDGIVLGSTTIAPAAP
ncbi:hypothetical protein Thimo_3387 [Thioflavicoccus mobilis 8321]|uniref:Uncharacterized protein n=2 Tax=Thioflavicoccus mobilis TaxID=80679 RepID=L0H1Z2_9GAMM|nr:hypothetical protein Thimo_3387 [Thioflavicoccus mobilis 8321]